MWLAGGKSREVHAATTYGTPTQEHVHELCILTHDIDCRNQC